MANMAGTTANWQSGTPWWWPEPRLSRPASSHVHESETPQWRGILRFLRDVGFHGPGLSILGAIGPLLGAVERASGRTRRVLPQDGAPELPVHDRSLG